MSPSSHDSKRIPPPQSAASVPRWLLVWPALWVAWTSTGCGASEVLAGAPPPLEAEAPDAEPPGDGTGDGGTGAEAPEIAPTLREVLADGYRYLGRHPELLELDPRDHPPVLEAFVREGSAVRMQYRQELAMAYGTLVSLHRGVVVLELTTSSASHRSTDGPPPRHWTFVPPHVARAIWREVERSL